MTRDGRAVKKPQTRLVAGWRARIEAIEQSRLPKNDPSESIASATLAAAQGRRDRGLRSAIFGSTVLIATALTASSCAEPFSATEQLSIEREPPPFVRLVDIDGRIGQQYQAIYETPDGLVVESGSLGDDSVSQALDGLNPTDRPLLVRADDDYLATGLIASGPDEAHQLRISSITGEDLGAVALPSWTKSVQIPSFDASGSLLRFFALGDSKSALCQAPIGAMYTSEVEETADADCEPERPDDFVRRGGWGLDLKGSQLELLTPEGDVYNGTVALQSDVAGDPETTLDDGPATYRSADSEQRALLGYQAFGRYLLITVGRCCADGRGSTDVLELNANDPGSLTIRRVQVLPFLTNVRLQESWLRPEDAPSGSSNAGAPAISVSGIDAQSKMVDYLYTPSPSGFTPAGQRQYRTTCSPTSVIDESPVGPSLVACGTRIGAVGSALFPNGSLATQVNLAPAGRAYLNGETLSWLDSDGQLRTRELDASQETRHPRSTTIRGESAGTRFTSLQSVIDTGGTIRSGTTGDNTLTVSSGDKSAVYSGFRQADDAYLTDSWVVGVDHTHRAAWLLDDVSRPAVLPLPGTAGDGQVLTVCSGELSLSIVEMAASEENAVAIRSFGRAGERIEQRASDDRVLPDGEVVGCVETKAGVAVLVESPGKLVAADSTGELVELPHPGSCSSVSSVDQSRFWVAVLYQSDCLDTPTRLAVSRLPLDRQESFEANLGQLRRDAGLTGSTSPCSATVSDDDQAVVLRFGRC
jgi:hypothetical protein